MPVAFHAPCCHRRAGRGDGKGKGLSSWGTAAEQFAQAHAQLLSDDSIHFDLPVYVQPKPPEWLKPLWDAISWLAPYMIYLFWGSVISGAAIILFLVFLEARGIAWRCPWQRTRREAETEDGWAPDAGAAQILLAQADALAAQGEYDAAVHLLLRRSVADIAGRLPDFLRPSLTARDIAGARSVPTRARSVAEIARIVESALFARRRSAPRAGGRRGAYERLPPGCLDMSAASAAHAEAPSTSERCSGGFLPAFSRQPASSCCPPTPPTFAWAPQAARHHCRGAASASRAWRS